MRRDAELVGLWVRARGEASRAVVGEKRYTWGGGVVVKDRRRRRTMVARCALMLGPKDSRLGGEELKMSTYALRKVAEEVRRASSAVSGGATF